MSFTLTFDGRPYTFDPFIVEWDVYLGMMDPDSWPTATPPAHFGKFNNVLDTGGTLHNLYDIFKPTWQRLRAAGVNYTSEVLTAISVSLDGVESGLQYQYSFTAGSHTSNTLHVDLIYPTGQQTQSFSLNYALPHDAEDLLINSLYCVRNNIVDCPDPTYEGAHWFALGAVNAYYVYQSVTQTGIPPQTVVALESKPITELLPADVRVRSANPYGVLDYSYTMLYTLMMRHL